MEKEKIFCETLHTPNICHHRELSQSVDENSGKYLNNFITNNSELLSVNSNNGIFLTPDSVKLIMKNYGDKKGYFEFVNGEQLGKQKVYTTGYEPFSKIASFPEQIHNMIENNAIGRGLARIFKQEL